jgi:hypothetical protein
LTIQDELNKELKRLQTKYNACSEYTVCYEPCEKTTQLPFNRDAVLNGEVNKVEHKLMIYCYGLEDALHTLRHEFFEAYLDCLIDPYVTIYNEMQRAYENSFMITTYKSKESIIERFVKLEECEVKHK